MEDYGLNESISYAHLMIVLFVCITLTHFPCSCQIFSPPQPEMIWGELAKNNRGVNNQNNISPVMKGAEAQALR